MSHRTPVEKKSYAIPRYGGFVPFMYSDNEHGRAYTKTTRKCFLGEKIDENSNLFNSTCFAFKRLSMQQDPTLSAWTYTHGKGTMQPNHPCTTNKLRWSTVARESYRKPEWRSKP